MDEKNTFRTDFPLIAENTTIYMDNAATSQRPQCVLDAVNDFYLKHNANPLRGTYPLSVEATDLYEEARKSVRDFIGAASSREIIFTRNTTESINLVAYSYGLNNIKSGDEILVSIMEHHSNLLPWQMVARQTGTTLRFLECRPDGSLDLDEVKSLITDKTKLVAITQVSNVLGIVNPIREIAALAHEKGAVIVVDGAQSTPHMPVHVQELDADFFAFSGHKIFGPMGIGVLYGKKKLLKQMPPFLSGGEMIDSVTREGAKYAELPHKFEAGTVNAAGAVGLKAALDYVRSVGYEEMQKRELAVTRRALEGLKQIPHVHVLGSEKAEEHTGILTFTIDDVHPHDVSEILISDGISVRAGHHCAQPLLNYLGVSAATRASFMFYNTEEEADAFVKSIASIRERMGYGK
ncbi:MAG: cysteine desulfurase [Agathobacter sp.]|nr:cysteine desulfurase [Agathobacter sp.]